MEENKFKKPANFVGFCSRCGEKRPIQVISFFNGDKVILECPICKMEICGTVNNDIYKAILQKFKEDRIKVDKMLEEDNLKFFCTKK